MKTLKRYWNERFKRPYLKAKYDNWLDKYNVYLKSATKIVDLGCGIGNNCLYLVEKSIIPVACDISEEALKKVKEVSPNISIICFDMADGLPFEDNSISVLIADLSIHYFNAETTDSIINDIYRVLERDGLFLCRLNSDKEMKNKENIRQENNKFYVENEGIYRRFFDFGEIERFFNGDMWDMEYVEEYELDRYSKKKILWEIAMKPRYIV